MHTYHSALPFTPHDTRLYHLYRQETNHSIAVLQGLNPTWTSCLSSLSLGGTIRNVSPDRTRLAVSDDFRVSVLDTRTTASQCQIPHTYTPLCLTFSPSDNTLATVNSKGLELWNTTTGINQGTQTLSGSHFYAVAFSSQGQYLLLSMDQSLHLHHGTNTHELSVLSTEWRHTNIIFTSDDTQVITGSEEGHIHFFTLSGNQLSEIRERRIFNKTGVLGLVLRHDGKRLASSGVDGTIRIYDLPSPLPIATLRRPESGSPISVIAYHPTEDELAVGQDNSVVLWRQNETPKDWTPSIHSYNSSWTTGIAYCENGTRMYTSAVHADMKLCATTPTLVQEPPKHTGKITCYKFHYSTSLLATGSEDMSIMLWKFTTGDCLRTLLGHTGIIGSLVFSDSGILLASGSADCTAIVWDVASGSLLHKLGPHDSCNIVMAFDDDDKGLVTSSWTARFLWELQSGELLRRLPTNTPRSLFGAGLGYIDGWYMVVEASDPEEWVYRLCRPPGSMGPSDSDEILSIVGDRVALLCNDGRVVILDISRVMHHWQWSW